MFLLQIVSALLVFFRAYRDQLVECMYGTHAMASVCGGMSGAEIAALAIRSGASVGGGTEGEVYRLKDTARRLDMAIKVYFIIGDAVTETDALVQMGKDYMMNRRLGQVADVVDIGTSITSVETRRSGDAAHTTLRISQKVSIVYPHLSTLTRHACIVGEACLEEGRGHNLKKNAYCAQALVLRYAPYNGYELRCSSHQRRDCISRGRGALLV